MPISHSAYRKIANRIPESLRETLRLTRSLLDSIVENVVQDGLWIDGVGERELDDNRVEEGTTSLTQTSAIVKHNLLLPRLLILNLLEEVCIVR